MGNDYEFWENYLTKLKSEILKLCRKKEELYIDLHIHSNYSGDGKQSINQIIESTSNQGFDIIAITDHDTLDAYRELYNILKNGMTKPLIIPGIEFTMDNREYGNQCHFLQLFVNPMEKTLIKNVKKNFMAMYNRSEIQFKRLKENITIQTILKKNKLSISYSEYLKYLKTNNLIAEYDTLCFYLIDKFKSEHITTFDILDLLEINNKYDIYEDRRQYKENRYKKLREKYEVCERNYYNSRFLLSMLAVREVDDDWWDEPSCGSLSVNSYGQMKVDELDNKYNIFFAHPSEKSLDVVRKIIKDNKRIVGVEKNIRSNYDDINNFYELVSDMDILMVIGSDSHDNSLEFYKDMEFFKIKSEDMKKVVLKNMKG